MRMNKVRLAKPTNEVVQRKLRLLRQDSHIRLPFAC
jgi:hypothetical protein